MLICPGQVVSEAVRMTPLSREGAVPGSLAVPSYLRQKHWQVKCWRNGRKEGSTTMLTETATGTQPRTKMFLDIPTAAEMAGFSIRHFRRIIEEDRIPIVQIGRKFFILGRDFSNWETSKKLKRPA